MSMKHFFLLSTALTLLLIIQAARFSSSSNLHYITPSLSSACPVESSCFTLSTLTANTSNHRDSITRLIFLPGNHNLNSALFLSNTGKFFGLSTLLNDTDLAAPRTNITCGSNASLRFTNISHLQISGLHFIGCSASVEGIDMFSLEDSSFYGIHGACSALELTQTNANIVRSFFSSNTVGTYRNQVSFLANLNDLLFNIQSYDARIGGTLLVSNTNLTISNSTFEDNRAQVGGAIFSELASNIVISNCTFLNNSARGCNDDRCHGGALFIDSGCSVTTHNSVFTNNTSEFGGGTITLFQATYLGEENVFTFNGAQRSGGVMFAYSSSSVTIDGSFFSRNEAGNFGGTLFASSGSDITIEHGSFSLNMAAYGGVLWVESSSLISVNHSSFNNNEAVEYAGVIYAYLISTAMVSMSSFDSNKANLSGGVILADSYSKIVMDGCIFINNEAGNDGGVVSAFTGCSIIVKSCNVSNSTTGKYGGVMLIAGNSNSAVRDSFFDKNNAGDYGGVTYIESSSSMIAKRSIFNANAAGNGGVVYASAGSSVTMTNCNFSNSTVDHNGGIMYVQRGSSITMDSSFVRNSTVGNNGGAIFATSRSSIAVHDSVFDKIEAGVYGGVAYIVSRSSMTVNKSTFNANKAGNDGGVVYAVEESGVTILNSSFDRNKADDTGGVLYAIFSSSIKVGSSSFHNSRSGTDVGVLLAHSGSNITVDDSFFSKNRAGDDGGVLYAYNQSNLTVHTCNFDSNEARDNGGVMYVVVNSRVVVNNSSFSNSEAGSGGGVMRAQSESSITVENSSFTHNRAGYSGGVMLVHSSSIITVYNSSFDKNQADNDGGVIFAQSNSSIAIDRSTFTSNKAGDDGGVVYSYDNIKITVTGSSFNRNTVGDEGGVAYMVFNSQINVNNSSFNSNMATDEGGVVFASRQSSINLNGDCDFFNNSANIGGVIHVYSASFVDLGSVYFNNKARSNGGVLSLHEGKTVVKASSFVNNSAGNSGGVFYTPGINNMIAMLERNTFHNNTASNGGVIALFANGLLSIVENSFSHNHAFRGGTIYLHRSNNLTVSFSNFIHNSASSDGGVIYSEYQNHVMFVDSDLNFNSANSSGGTLYLQGQTELIIAGVNCTFVGNQAQSGGAIYAIDSKVDSTSQTLLMANNTAFNSGGALYTSKVNLNLSSENSILIGNVAHNGGAVYASESKISMEAHSSTEIRGNSAIGNGGGLYLINSELNIGGNNSYISENRATKTGGGLHAANSSITVRGAVHLTHNEAENGGGVSLERYAKLYGDIPGNGVFNFVSNRASYYGGALYVNDETNPDMCSILLTQNVTSATECFSTSAFINFLDNSAGVSGTNIFGGLLDRCTVNMELSIINSKDTEMHSLGVTALTNFSSITNSDLGTISSHPVQLCFCRDSQPDCDYQPESIQVQRGKNFSIKLIAYDQVNHAVNANIECSLNSSAGGLGEDQVTQQVTAGCTPLQFDIFSPFTTEDLTLSMNGPCNVTGISKQNIEIEITCTCPIGFQVANNDKIKCVCVCDQVLQQYDIIECDTTAGSIIREGNYWISYVNETDPSLRGYIIHPNCPYDYCYPPDNEVSINLNLPNGSDAQCASNRMGTLCGTCKPGLSISLGSSQCLRCPAHWPAILVTIVIAFVLSGIGLVALLLVLNLTIAVGTINAIIVYANIVGANKSAFFSTSEVSFASVLISWLNFDIGIHTCFFDGMDTYIKTWVELAFPVYIILLVVAIIKLSKYYDAFGHLIGKKDPVATLATLILLSYTKLLQTIITALSYATLKYPSGLTKYIWLPDATMGYLNGKHIALFILAVFILLFSTVYTLVLLTIQWSPLKLVQYIRIPEVCCIPYTPRHRYWTGLLLLIRAGVYVLSSFNLAGDPRVTLLSTTFIMSLLLVYIAVFGIRMYSNEFINAMEIITYFNIVALSIFTWFLFDTKKSQTVVTNISVGIIFTQLLVVIIYHTCRYANSKAFQRIQNTTIYKKLNEKMKPTSSKKSKEHDQPPPPDDTDIHQFYELLDMIDRPVNTSDYESITPVDQEPKPVKPTQSVVELPKPHQPPSSSMEDTKEESELESEQQQNEQRDSVVVMENSNQLESIDKQYLNNCSEIDIADCDHNTAPGTRMGLCANTDVIPVPNDSSLDIKN